MTAREFHSRKAYAVPGEDTGHWHGDYASQSPLNAFYLDTKGGGACGTKSYLALPGNHSDQFYAEASPIWERPRLTHDLRDTRATFYLKALSPITVNDGYKPYLFIDDWDDNDKTLCGWYQHEPLTVGDDWTLNTVDLVNDESKWTRYSNTRPLDTVLSRVGFIGVMYLSGIDYKNVNACGILGIDEFTFDLPMRGVTSSDIPRRARR